MNVINTAASARCIHTNDGRIFHRAKASVLMTYHTVSTSRRGFCGVGSGSGMVVQRGFPQPPSYHVPRLRNAPIGHFFDVITNGYGVMYSYATRVEPEDRWAIAAYIRALQLSHNMKASELTPTEQQKLENQKG